MEKAIELSKISFTHVQNTIDICNEAGYSPIFPVLFQPLFLKKNRAQEYKDGRDMANELLRRSRILVVCGEADTEEMLEDIALAKRLRIAATTLEGILTIDNKAASSKTKKRLNA